ncbi:enoyl-CoA hydratase-related protein [Nocardioides zeae]|uniref:Enoyl-CoA hydratase-related protein n=1 Tax=Nocardioides imazamoxiresistens TaxID=3231893 RepID=A0ABU3PSM4_9ACTN|nr:enoyl-CoA hydratase-related protein [Nocardioides zeae]MDT9592184.1 enoyl-CoA hydratase-related protein [Nocardioides zeae]
MTRGEGAADGRLDVRLDGHVAVVTLDRPEKRNALTLPMVAALREVTARLQAESAVRVVVLTGAGDKAFCAGGDLRTMIPVALDAGRDTLNPDPTERFLSGITKPVVAAVRGACFGAGLELLLGTDLRVAGSDARFGLPEAALGMIPGDGTHIRLPQQVPMAVAKSMLLRGEVLDAQRAVEVGLVNEVAAPEDVLDVAMSIAAELAAKGPIALQTSKEIVTRTTESAADFALEHALNGRVLSSQDAREGVAAFLEKRDPQFRGH